MEYNPYDLLVIKINGKKAYARPFVYDSSTVSANSVKNSFGYYVKPVKVVSTCPDCGQGLELDVRYPDPPFPVLELNCYICRSKNDVVRDPFIDPFKAGILVYEDMNPEVYNKDKHKIGDTTVSERLKKDASIKPKAKTKKKQSKSKEEPKEAIADILEANADTGFIDHGHKRPLESADGISPEAFDDSDLVE